MTHCGWIFRCLLLPWWLLGVQGVIWGQDVARTVVTERMHHLRNVEPREWSEFPLVAEADALEWMFAGEANPTEMTLLVRQQDVKQHWRVVLNDQLLGSLTIDENDMVLAFPIAAKTLRQANTLRIEPMSKQSRADDIRVGQVSLVHCPRQTYLQQATLQVEVLDAGSKERTPARITIVDDSGALVSTGAESGKQLAIRPGIVYTSTGRATIPLPVGKYRVFAGRGFEYSLAEREVKLEAGETSKIELTLQREVNTEGWVASDPHVHTRTHSGHGDATVQERMITLAGEGIELPIATDHNVHVDHVPFAREMQVQQFFTPVIGNEVTTRTGHFNIFPVVNGAAVPGYQSDDWQTTLRGIFATPGVRVAILNHARDIHGGTTPFGPRHFNEAAGEMLDDWHVGFNGMEVINSGATQTDAFQLFHDWLALTNRGRRVTPVGSSDSHDVGRHFVGQGRTYIRCPDQDPGDIDVPSAVSAFLEGRVVVSYGLFVELQVGNGGVGDIVPATDAMLPLKLVVRGPSWAKLTRLQVFGNGQSLIDLRGNDLRDVGATRGILWQGTKVIARPAHDTALVVLASGPGIDGVYWKTAKAYQPDSPEWQAHTLSCTGPVYLDVNGDGKWTSPHEFAQGIIHQSKGDVATTYAALRTHDAAVATQAALLLHQAGRNPLELTQGDTFQNAAKATQAGILAYLNAWRVNEQVRGSGR